MAPPSRSKLALFLCSAPPTGHSQLVGKWQIVQGTRSVKAGTVEFTKGGTALLSWEDLIPNALGNSQRQATLKYTLKGNTLRLEEPGNKSYRQKCDIQIEFISADEVIFFNQKNSLSFDWLDGRLRRMKSDSSADMANESPTGPIKEADSALRPLDIATAKDYLTKSEKVKVFNVLLEKGKSYRIDMISPQIDSYLFLKFKGQTVAQNDDGGGGRNALIIFQPRQTGVYQIEATSLVGRGIGSFTLEAKME